MLVRFVTVTSKFKGGAHFHIPVFRKNNVMVLDGRAVVIGDHHGGRPPSLR